MLIKSPVYRAYARTMAWVTVMAVGTGLLGFLPYDDLLQGGWVFLSGAVGATLALSRRLNEDDLTRYRRQASANFKYWIDRDADLLRGLFAEDVPQAAVRWLQAETGANLMACERFLIVDSLAKKKDEPGQLIFRFGLEVGKILGAAKPATPTEAERALSKAFVEWSEAWTDRLGQALVPGVFVRRMHAGDWRPYGVHMTSPQSKCLAVIDAADRDATRFKVALSLLTPATTVLSEEAWQEAKETLVYRHFPMFRAVAGGSGPQKRSSPLFLQLEQPLTAAETDAFVEKLVPFYREFAQRFKLDDTTATAAAVAPTPATEPPPSATPSENPPAADPSAPPSA